MLLQPGIPTSFTFTIGWVDVVILAILVVAFLRGINQLNGPAALVTISR